MRSWVLAVVAVLAVVQGCPREQRLTISAAASLKDVLTKVVSASGIPATVNLGASGALQRQIEQGAPVDVFLSAGSQQLDALEQAGLVDGARVPFAANALVLVVPTASSVTSADALKSMTRIAMAEPGSVPAGKHAEDALRLLGYSPGLILAKDVRQVLNYVESGEVEAGLVYATDARASSRVRGVATLKTSAPIGYAGVVIKGSRHPEDARRFLEFLRSAPAARLLASHGFLPAAVP